MSASTADAPAAGSSPAAEPVAVEQTANVAPAASEQPSAGKAPTNTIDTVADKPVENGNGNGDGDAPKADEKADPANGAEKASTDKKSEPRGVKRSNDHQDGGRFKKTRVGAERAPREDFSELPETDDPDQIRAQVEFYFSNNNLAVDKHLFFQTKGPQNDPVPIKHLATFKRMRRFQPYSAIVAALRESEHVEVVDDAEYAGTGCEGVRRKVPIEIPTFQTDKEGATEKMSLDDMYNRLIHASKNSLDQSIYVKDFGDEKDAGQIALENFFKPYGSVCVRKRRSQEDDSWKGSVFVEFGTKADQEAFLALDPKPKYNGNELFIESKKDYSRRKCEEKGITPSWERTPHFRQSNRDGGRGFGRGGGRGYGRGRGMGRGREGGGGRGGGRFNNRDRDNRRSGNNRSRDDSRSPSPFARRRRDRSDSVDEKDWKERRNRDQRKERRSPKPAPAKIVVKEDE
ncbi:hypothetical protein P154DRAFT_539685 [Amniculicola lignicola CBS 123094]|uniref:HTH La-type RNA-binding domain-containing protein n=1 Tax=Amniculicola lignicola CBS 123094 TaxID=1392246 RepID=A0A6A5VZF0_9PLEO|nr:hypothetical protein P154DRAFT_539685 [Amniculicola lignicola CBS 123094]